MLPFLLLLVMLFVGPIQLLASFIMILATKNTKIVRYLSVYFVGVVIYGLVMGLVYQYDPGFSQGLSRLLFFGGAMSLAGYNFMVMFFHPRLP